MIKIEYPVHRFKIKEEESKKMIFDEFRRLWVSLTKEEWVRQNVLQYLVQIKQYPSSLIAVEKEIQLGELKKRFDILVYNAHHKPWMMIECKAMDIMLTEKVLHQVLRYNLSVPVPFLVITNGSFMMGFERKETSLIMLDELPHVIY